MGKICTCNQEKPKIKTGLCEPTVLTHQMWGANGAGQAGKVPRPSHAGWLGRLGPPHFFIFFFSRFSQARKKSNVIIHSSYCGFISFVFEQWVYDRLYRSLSIGGGDAVTVGTTYAYQPSVPNSHDTHTVKKHRQNHAESNSKSEKTCMKQAESAQNKRTVNEVESFKLRMPVQTQDGLFFYQTRFFHAQCWRQAQPASPQRRKHYSVSTAGVR